MPSAKTRAFDWESGLHDRSIASATAPGRSITRSGASLISGLGRVSHQPDADIAAVAATVAPAHMACRLETMGIESRFVLFSCLARVDVLAVLLAGLRSKRPIIKRSSRGGRSRRSL